MRKLIGSLFGIAVLAGALLAGSQSQAQVKQGKTRPLTTKQLMGGLVGPQCKELGAMLQGAGPADEKAWEMAGTKAALLNECGYTLMADGRCPDATWKGACDTLQNCSKVLLEKVAAKDASGAREAFTAMTGACKSCHAAHK